MEVLTARDVAESSLRKARDKAELRLREVPIGFLLAIPARTPHARDEYNRRAWVRGFPGLELQPSILVGFHFHSQR